MGSFSSCSLKFLAGEVSTGEAELEGKRTNKNSESLDGCCKESNRFIRR